jgi:nucleoside-diphosphate-sugar epimerase
VAQACHAALRRQELQITDGTQTREWNSVYEIAEAVMAAGAHPERGSILNIGGGPQASVSEVASMIFELAEAPLELLKIGSKERRIGDVEHLWSDSRRARELLDLPAPAPLSESLADTLEWHRWFMEKETVQ